MLEYSRDALAAPLEHLGRVLADVREGRFSPDALRSGRRGQAERILEHLGYAEELTDPFEEEVAVGTEELGDDQKEKEADPDLEGSEKDAEDSSGGTSSCQCDASEEKIDDKSSSDSDEGSVSAGTPRPVAEGSEVDEDDLQEEIEEVNPDQIEEPAPAEETVDGRHVYMHPKWGTFHLSKGFSGLDLKVRCGKRRMGLVGATAGEAAAAPAESLCLRCFRGT